MPFLPQELKYVDIFDIFFRFQNCNFFFYSVQYGYFINNLCHFYSA